MRRTLLPAFALLAASCSSGGFSADDVAETWEQQFCESQVECGAAPDVETCRESVDSSYWLEVEAKIIAGQIDFSGNAAKECLDILTAGGCQPRDTPLAEALRAACLDGFQGQGQVGDTCIVDEECATGLCIFAPGQGDDVCDLGQCFEFADQGDDCAGSPCLPGLYCDVVEFTCEPLVAVGAVCEQIDACDPGAICFEGECVRQGDPDGACIPELGFSACRRFDNWCDPADEICKPRFAVGDTCDGEIDECNLDSVCIDAECRLLPGPGDGCDPGVGCAGSSECESGLCQDVVDNACTADVSQ